MHTLWIIGGILLGLALFALVSYVVMRLWNWLVPTLFNGPTIRFQHALGLLLLSKILFGGFGGWRGHHRGSQGWKHSHRIEAPAPARSTF